MNPIYRFTIRGQQTNENTYTSEDLSANAYYDLSQGVGNITPDTPVSVPIANTAYCLKISIHAGDKLAIATQPRLQPKIYAWAVTDKDNRIIQVSDEDTIDNPKTVEIQQDGTAYINLSYAPNEFAKFSVKQTIYDTRICRPIYKDLTKEYELENSQMFFRKKLSDKLTLMRDDYSWLDSQPFETQFILYVDESFNLGKSWQPFVQGKFAKTDCTWNVDDTSCEVKIDTYDEYNDIINGWEKEYDLIKLTPEIQRLTIIKRPLIQVYIPGDDVVTCFLSGTYWEQEVVETVDSGNDLVNKYFFGLANQSRVVVVDAGDSNMPNIAGIYYGKGSRYDKLTGDYYIEYDPNHYISTNLEDVKPCFVIYRTSDKKALYYNTENVQDEVIQSDVTFTAEPFTSYKGNPKGAVTKYDIYMRWLVDKERVFDVDTSPIPQEDILDDNRNYRRCVRYTSDYFQISFNESDEPTEYGLNNNEKYYAPPYSSFGQKYYPISKSNWGDASVWFAFSLFEDVYEEEGRTPWTFKNAYPLHSVIQVLLRKFSNIEHSNTPEYSQFLYGDRNPITGQKFTLLLTPKSNLLHGNYDHPAQKAETTLKSILDTLTNLYQCYWYVEDGKLKIEHVSFFKNGYTYDEATPGISFDLTEMENWRNGKKWGYLTSNYEFDKSDMPARYQFSWMDDVTTAFEGYPIEIRSKFVTEDNIEDITVSNMTTDVDYMLLNPNAISQDGFVLFAAVNTNIWIDRPSFFVYDGYYNASGKIVYNATGDGKGWRNTLFKNVTPGVTYRVIGYDGQQINGFLWNFFDSAGKHISQSDNTTGQVTLPDNCYSLGMSWRAQEDAIPTIIGVVTSTQINVVQSEQLGLPFVQRNVEGADLTMQNGYLSFLTLIPNYWIYDLPAKTVTINQQDMQLTHISRQKKQKVKIPALNDIDTKKLVKTYLGNGQIEKISVNLSSRINEIELKYDTEQ